jgi:hypothetical protein
MLTGMTEGVEMLAFITGRLIERETAARAYVPLTGFTHRHGTSEPGWQEHAHAGGGGHHGHDPDTGGQVPIAEVSDPARVLRSVQATRRILARYEDCLIRMEDPDYPAGVARDQAREYEDFVLPNLAAEFSDHPGYDREWAP